MSLRRRSFERRYRRGGARWDTGITPPEIVAYIEGGATPGRALDLGCGTGTNAIYLARHGWEVVGIDFSELAIASAREKVQAAGVPGISLIHGDVTRLAAEGVTGTFDFVLDIGCFHGVAPGRRDAYVREVAAHTRQGAILMLFAFGPARRPRGRGRTREPEIRQRFGPIFELERIELGTRPAGAAWFTLRRRPKP